VGFLAALSSIISPTLVFLFLINTSGAIILFIYLLIALGEIRMRQQMERQGEILKLKMWFFPGLSYLVAGSIVAVFVMMMFAPGQFIQVAASAFSVVFIYAAFLLRQKFGQ
jgi:GABA permease